MKTYLILGAALLVAACGANDTNEQAANNSNEATADGTMADGNDMTTTATTASNLPTNAAGYLAMAGAGDMWEIESSKAFMAKSGNTDLKKFAQMMIDNHTQSAGKLKAVASSAGLMAPAPKLDAEQQRMLDEIKAADAASIDPVYMRHQATAHQKALALHQGFAANGDNEALTKAAGEIAPVVQKHITALGKLSASI